MIDYSQGYYPLLAAAMIRGKLRNAFPDDIRFTKNLYEISPDQLNELISIGKEHKIKLHKFKLTNQIARVRIALGILKGIRPECILDIGSGKGTFLWPFVNEFPSVKIDSIDLLQERIDEINFVAKGGIPNIQAHFMSATKIIFSDNTFDVVTALEVLEHIPDYKKAIKEIVRVTKKYVIVSVPSKEDDNPEHLRLFSRKDLESDFKEAGMKNIKFEYVLNHLILVAKK